MGKKSITRNYIYNMAYQVLILVLPLITTPYLARVLGAEGTGIYSYTYAIVTYFILFGSLGIALYGQREIAYAQEDKEARKRIFFELVLFRFITVGIAIVCYALTFMRGETYQIYYRILIIELIAAAFDISWFFQGLEEFKKTVLRNILVRVCSVALVFTLVKTREDLAKFTLIYSLADLIGNLSLWLYLPKYFKGIKVKEIKVFRHLPQILLLFIPQVANQLYKILDTTMIGRIIADKSELGFYEQSQKVVRLLLTVVTSLGVVMIPRMASTFASGDKKKINEYMKMSFRFVFFLSFPMMFGLISVSKEFVPVFFGDGYDKVAPIMCIISPIIILMGIANVIGTQYMIPTKKQKEYTISIIIGVVFNFICNYFMIIKWGAIGASISTVLSQLIVDIVEAMFVKKEVEFKDMLSLAGNYFSAGIIMFALCLGVRYGLSILPIFTNVAPELTKFYLAIRVAIVVAVGILSYMGLLIFIFKDKFINTFLDKIKSKFMKGEVIE